MRSAGSQALIDPSPARSKAPDKSADEVDWEANEDNRQCQQGASRDNRQDNEAGQGSIDPEKMSL